MKCLLMKNNKNSGQSSKDPMSNQKGSVILIAIMLLALMTIIAISASSTAITEAFIIRNVAAHKQNISMVESAALQITQDALLNVINPGPELAQTAPAATRKQYVINTDDWDNPTLNGGVSKRDEWYSFGTAFTGRVLDDPDNNPATFPQYIVPDMATEMTFVDDVRNEAAEDPLRVALIGWEAAPLSSIVFGAGKVDRRRALIVAEYMSANFGMTRLEVGIERDWD